MIIIQLTEMYAYLYNLFPPVLGEGEVIIHILHTLYFDAERKRMSVIVQHPATNDIVLYCKGADTAIIPQLRQIASGNQYYRNELNLFYSKLKATLCMNFKACNSGFRILF